MSGRDRALVVGCDAYPLLRSGDLKGAVRDALAMAEWLTGAHGAGLSRAEVTLLLSPSALGAQPEAGQVDGPATRGQLARALAGLRGVRNGGRLYVYLAGHGCRSDPDRPALALDAVCLENFDPFDPGATSVGVQDLVARLKTLTFAEVIVIVDACRNFPYRESFDICRLGREPAGGPAEARVFLLQATEPGEVAVGAGGSGAVRGVFSQALTDGLAGTASAKVFDDTAEPPYQVRWSTLCRYLAGTLRDQTARSQGEGDLVLTTFPDGWFDDVALQVEVQRGPAERDALDELVIAVRYSQLYAAEDGYCELRGQNPGLVRVPPRRHRVRASAPGDYFAKDSVDAYADTSVQLTLAAPAPRPLGDATDGSILRSAAGDAGMVEVQSFDPADVIEITDLGGAVTARAVGHCAAELPLGSYTAVLRRGYHHVDVAVPMDVDEPAGYQWMDLGEGDPAGEPERSWWAGLSPMAVLVARTEREPLGPGESLLIVGDEGPPQLLRRRAPESCRDRVRIAGRRLEIPVLPGVVTVVAVADDQLWVGLYDDRLRSELRSLALLDRAQMLLASGRAEAAAAVWEALGPGPESLVASVLTGQSAAIGERVLSSALPVGEAYRQLGPGPWAVLT